MNAKETLDLISKQWCTTEDLMKLANFSRPTAMKYKKEIAERLIKQGYIIPKHLIPMKEVVDRLNINILYLESRIQKSDYNS